MADTSERRVIACLTGIATGDAVGKQTETLSFDDVRRWYPHGIGGFEGPPGEIVPRYRGSSKHEWRIGETTDDTERTLAVARALMGEGSVSHVSIGREMLACAKCVHPGVRSLWEFHQAGDPARTTAMHDGCGAAVRVAPVGILSPSASLDQLVSGAREASIPTHGGSLAIAAAAATAAAVSAAIDGAPHDGVFDFAVRAAILAQNRWPGRAPASFADALVAVRRHLLSSKGRSASDIARRCFPDQPLTIVPLALALATTMDSAEDAILLGANVGGDSDSVASIAGGILGAMYPDTVSEPWLAIVEAVNGHGLTAIAAELTRLRRAIGSVKSQ